MNIAINKSNCAYSKQKIHAKNKTKNKNEAFINVLENKISEKDMDSTRIKYFAKNTDGVYYSMHERKDGSTFKVYHPEIKESNTKLVLPKMNLFPQKTLTAGELNEDEVIHLKDLSKITKIKRPKDGVFASKELAIQFVKENYDFTNCTFDEYNEGMKILLKNDLLSSDDFISWGMMGSIRHLPNVVDTKTTNSLYLKIMDNSAHNWFELIKEYTTESMKLGGTNGKEELKSINDLEKVLR